ncbi:hypothetical protein GC194_04930 [bacterium]|nr:hypothetical protein [bacterium]
MPKEWDSEKIAKNWIDNHINPHTEHPNNYKYQKLHRYKDGDDIPLEELEKHVIKVARIVDRLGYEYVSLFKRAENELLSAKQKNAEMQRIKNLAQNSHTYCKRNPNKPNSFLLQAWTQAVYRSAVLMSHH